eukprot:scaffold43696_cov48-Attheya_sp.AAC.2
MEDEEVYDGDEEQLRKRFEAHLPKYGTLWRSLNQVSRKRLQLPEPQQDTANNRNKENVLPPNNNHMLECEPNSTGVVVSSSNSPTKLSKSDADQKNRTQSFLPAILGKQSITMTVHNINSTNEKNCCEEDGLCDGLCADPIFEEESPAKHKKDWNSPTTFLDDAKMTESSHPPVETPYRTKNDLESSMDGSSPAASRSRASLPSSPDSSFGPSSDGGSTVVNLSRLMITHPEEEEDPPEHRVVELSDRLIEHDTSEKAAAVSDIGEDSTPISTPRNNLTPNHFTPSSIHNSPDDDDDDDVVSSTSGSTVVNLSRLMNSTGKDAPVGGTTGSSVGFGSPISHSSSSSSSGDSVLDLSAYFPTMEETELAMKETLNDDQKTQDDHNHQANDGSEHSPKGSPSVPSFGTKEGQCTKLDSHVEFGANSDDDTEKKSMSSPFHSTTSLLLGSPLSMDEVEHEDYHNSTDENEPISSPPRGKDSTSSKHDNDEQSMIDCLSLGDKASDAIDLSTSEGSDNEYTSTKQDEETSQSVKIDLCENGREGAKDAESSAKREHASRYRDTHTIENLSTSEEEWNENSIHSDADDSVHSEKKEFSVIILSDDESEEDSILMGEDDSSWDGSFQTSKNNDASFHDSARSQILDGIDLKKNDTISIDLETSDNDASESEFQSERRKERPKRNKRKTTRTSIEYIESDDDDDDDDKFDIRRKKETDKNRRKAQPPPRRKRTEKEHKTTSKISKAAFARERDSLTKEIFSEFNRSAFDRSLSAVEVTWSKRLTTTAGITRLKRLTISGTQQRVATIELSTKIIDDSERLRATLLHEMCHAAAWLVDGIHKPPHGQCFKKWANIKDVTVSTTHDYQITYKYAWACATPNCGVVIKRHSRSLDINRKCCGRCQGKLVEIEVPGSSADNKSKNSWDHTPKKKRAPSGFSLFIKEHSKSVRQRLEEEQARSGGTKVTQPEVMKECGRLWREQQQNPSKDASSALEKDSGTTTIQDLLSHLSVIGIH